MQKKSVIFYTKKLDSLLSGYCPKKSSEAGAIAMARDSVDEVLQNKNPTPFTCTERNCLQQPTFTHYYTEYN